ncbi:MAG: TauD/TfdA family dioxygenase [Pseudomonadales bacterium]|jgi:taurine dioxygenase|nr:TauD/TfdA family dioxygenase [Pseudomonadales bacterium]MDP6471767.1 TauD/TfdA family dioxygenase [Pseudomonadales bacterium]MDP6970270.1 TauD/TfdA family dioxygenase [Pseudomonadales bacterium]|tara:strand:+ start:41 stop:880 length:840 start_codon:yes stop_codon:yes gene_type:complete
MKTYRTLDVDNLTPNLGGEVVSSIDLAHLTRDQIDELRLAFRDRLVLVFRAQRLTRDQHKAFGRLFGDLHPHPAKTNLGLPGDPEIFDIRITSKTRVANGEAWHSDLSCEPLPPIASALYITQTPPSGGGDTLFANMHEAFETLSAPIREWLGGLTAFHDGRKDLKAYGFELRPEQTYPSASHPVVVRHQDTGRRLLFVNEPFTVRINELTAHESEVVLAMLYRHIETSTRIQCRVRWQPNTVVVWDNYAVQHHAVWDYYPESRTGERVTVRATVPPRA